MQNYDETFLQVKYYYKFVNNLLQHLFFLGFELKNLLAYYAYDIAILAL